MGCSDVYITVFSINDPIYLKKNEDRVHDMAAIDIRVAWSLLCRVYRYSIFRSPSFSSNVHLVHWICFYVYLMFQSFFYIENFWRAKPPKITITRTSGFSFDKIDLHSSGLRDEQSANLSGSENAIPGFTLYKFTQRRPLMSPAARTTFSMIRPASLDWPPDNAWAHHRLYGIRLS